MLDLLKTPLFIIKVRLRAVLMEAAWAFGGTVLDVGCGSAGYRELVPHDRYWTIDRAPQLDGVPYVRALAEALPVRDEAVDTVICTEVLEHLPEPSAGLSEAYRVLRGGGVLYVTAPMTWGLHYEPDDYWRFTIHGIRRLVEASGFAIEWDRRVGGAFSAAGARLADVAAEVVTRVLGIISRRHAERAGALAALPVSLAGHWLGLLLDRADRRDALGWAVLARKAPPATGHVLPANGAGGES